MTREPQMKGDVEVQTNPLKYSRTFTDFPLSESCEKFHHIVYFPDRLIFVGKPNTINLHILLQINIIEFMAFILAMHQAMHSSYLVNDKEPT